MDTSPITSALIYNARTGEIVWRNSRLPATTRGKDRLYIYVGAAGRVYHAERVAWLLAKGEWPRKITFLNGDKFDLRMSNLRELSPADMQDMRRQEQEQALRDAARARASLPHRVMQDRNTGLYYARVLVRGQIKVSPKVRTPEEARLLRDAMSNPGG